MKLTHYKLFRKIIKDFPLKLQEKWDQSRFECNKVAWKNEVKNVYLMLDLENEFFLNHKVTKNDFFLIHHPIFTKGSYKAEPLALKMLLKIKKANAAVLFMHTNYDFNELGMNFQFAQTIFEDFEIQYSSLGVSLLLKKPWTTKQLVDKIKKQINPSLIKYQNKYANQKLDAVHVLLGSGASLLDLVMQQKIKNKKVQLYITGDMKWHDWQKANLNNFFVLEIPHYTEFIFCQHMEKYLKQNFNEQFKITSIPTNLKFVYE